MLRLLVSTTVLAAFHTLAVAGLKQAPYTRSLSPAAEVLTANEALFGFEETQLTERVLERLAHEIPGSSSYAFRSSESGSTKSNVTKKCKTYPGDDDWPSEDKWRELNTLLGDALIKTVPEASICYSNGSIADSAACISLTESWGNSTLRIEDATSIRSILFQGMTCMPPNMTGYFLGQTPSCSVGGYPEYVVNASTVAQIQLAVNFAREHNVRLVIKNTGHDFGGKSVGKGALSIWTHHLKDKEFYADYKAEGWSGPAVKLAAGVQVYEAYALAKQHEVSLVGGEGKTVGFIGGYIQGGGHSPLTSIYGMAADHILSISLVTSSGAFLTANSTYNRDLFWAVSGGGGSTYGVVTSMVLKAFPKLKTTTMRYNVSTSGTFSKAQFWAMQKAYVDDFDKYATLGYYSYFRIRHVGDGIFSDMTSWVAPNTSASEFRASIAPMLRKWDAIGVPVSPIITEYDNFPDAWADGFPQETWTVAMRQASRFFPGENLATEGKRVQTLDAIRSVFDEGANLILFNIRNPPGSDAIDNAVNPAWRRVLMFAIMFVTWNVTDPAPYVTQKSRNMTFEWNPWWKALTPGSGTYMSESDYIEPDWQESFFGAKYGRLLEAKRKWDPESVFYAQNAVGSEEWEMSEMLLGHLPSQNSKLCRKS